MEISKYKSVHEHDILAAIGNEPDWRVFTHEAVVDTYRQSLKHGIVYVCYSGNHFCGYVRAILDKGFAVYISELYVVPLFRNQKVGQLLLDRVASDFSNLTVYALSDEDAYYHKKGYKKIGSVFEIPGSSESFGRE